MRGQSSWVKGAWAICVRGMAPRGGALCAVHGGMACVSWRQIVQRAVGGGNLELIFECDFVFSSVRTVGCVQEHLVRFRLLGEMVTAAYWKEFREGEHVDVCNELSTMKVHTQQCRALHLGAVAGEALKLLDRRVE
ncbi:hypothetical protein Taro_041177 [Colocasia esculenta]|uniref:Uncharacterized protein n=1 Tax=Colocasia esculenta TaxID=4460 RepID=A0A843WKW9_COLES|nr:hypothetical protein [Colocasia esculenta]